MEAKIDFSFMCNKVWKERHSYIYINKIDNIINSNMFKE